MASQGGKSKGVYVVTDAELESAVGGTFVVQPGKVLKVAALDAADRGVVGGKPMAVYVVDAAEAARRGSLGGKPVPVSNLTSANRGSTGPQIAQPVYVVSGSLGGGAVPPTPALGTLTNAQTPGWLLSFTDNIQDSIPYCSLPAGSISKFYWNQGAWSLSDSIGGTCNLIWTPPYAPITSADMWIDLRIRQDTGWGGSNDRIGGSLRNTFDTENYYLFGLGAANYTIEKVIAGAWTTLRGPTATTITTGDRWRFQVEGSLLSLFKNNVLVDSITDTDLSAMGVGVGFCGDSFDIDNKVNDYHCGDLPFPTSDVIPIYNDFTGNWAFPENGTQVTATDFSIIPASIDDQNYITGGSTNGEPLPHYIEFDFGAPRQTSRFRSWSDGGVTENWTDVSVYYKLDVGDAWTMVGNTVPMSNGGVAGFGEVAFTQCIGRYMRIEINSTADGANDAETDEIEWFFGDEDTVWWTTETVHHHGETFGAWQASEALAYTGTLRDWNYYDSGIDLVEAVGTVPWTAGVGWNFDGTNYFDTGWIATGAGQSFAVRFQNAVVAKPIFGDAGPNGIQVTAATTTQFLITNQTTDTLVVVPDTSADFTMVLAGDQLYINGVFNSTMPSYTPAAGGVNVHLGGLDSVAGSGDVVAFAIYERQLTSAEALAISTKMQAL